MISTKRERFLKFDDRARNVISLPELVDEDFLKQYKDCNIVRTAEESLKCFTIEIQEIKKN
jgi:hypothetical protein